MDTSETDEVMRQVFAHRAAESSTNRFGKNQWFSRRGLGGFFSLKSRLGTAAT